MVAILAICAGAIADDDNAGNRGFWYDAGTRYQNVSGSFSARFQLRAQIRYSNLNADASSDPATTVRDESEFELNRGRLKLGGHAGPQWMKYYTEYDFSSDTLLDLWVEPEPSEALGFRIGQFKVPYNRERFDSSGAQQFAERSVVTPPFTLDRQIGITAMGRLFVDSAVDSSYWAGVFRGNGRGGGSGDDYSPLVFGRWQWNVNRTVLPFSRSDIKRHAKPTTSLAVAAATNRSPYTRFSSQGGGQLEGLEGVVDGEFGIDQAMAEFAFMYRGFSAQSEYHFKTIKDYADTVAGAAHSTDLSGFYFDAGYFFSELIRGFPRPLELIARVATVNAEDLDITPDTTELAVGGNWFFNAHRNKLTLDVTRQHEHTLTERGAFWRVRLQWDVSL